MIEDDRSMIEDQRVDWGKTGEADSLSTWAYGVKGLCSGVAGSNAYEKLIPYHEEHLSEALEMERAPN